MAALTQGTLDEAPALLGEIWSEFEKAKLAREAELPSAATLSGGA